MSCVPDVCDGGNQAFIYNLIDWLVIKNHISTCIPTRYTICVSSASTIHQAAAIRQLSQGLMRYGNTNVFENNSVLLVVLVHDNINYGYLTILLSHALELW